jgi:hypothetical protein
MRVLFILLLLFIVPAFSIARPAADTNTVKIVIRPTFNGKPLKLEKQYYVNTHGDTFYIDGFRFYISNISFTGQSDVNAHLFDAEDSSTYSFFIKNAPAGNFAAMQLVIGVDSIANTSGANEGDLDPSKGMYWAWNTGYIMAKLEGRSKVCRTLHSAFEFHIGGYMPPFNTARTVTLKAPANFQGSKAGMPVVYLNADIAAWFTGVDLSQLNSIVIPGDEAMKIADNYAKMLSIEEISFTQTHLK